MESTENIPKLKNIDNTEIDGLLQELVLFVDWSDTNYGITVQVGGNLISGRLISKKEYLTQNVNNIQASSESVDNIHFHALETFFDVKAQEEKELVSFAVREDLPDGQDLGRKPHALHLMNVRIYENLSNKPLELSMLRVKLSSVDSFFIGELNAS